MKEIKNKIVNMKKRAVISLTNDDSKAISYAQVEYLDNVGYMEAIYPYGMSANAPKGNICLIEAVGGDEANLAGIPYSQQDRFKNLKEGEVVFGSPKGGSYLKFLENGDIEIYAKGNIIVKSDSNLNIESKESDIKVSDQMKFESNSHYFQLNSSGDFDSNAKFHLGTGGQAIARVGDSVLVDGKTGSITVGSSNNTSN